MKPLKREFWPKLLTKEMKLCLLETQLQYLQKRKKMFKNSMISLWEKALLRLKQNKPHLKPQESNNLLSQRLSILPLQEKELLLAH